MINNHNLNVRGAAISEDDVEKQETRDILFPHQLEDVAQIAVDIGGSLAKVVYFSRTPDSPGGRMNFVKFETQHINDCVDFIHKVLYTGYHGQIPVEKRVIKATGGGAHKYYELFKEKLGVTMQREDEMECLITGLNFLVRQIPYEVFTYDERRAESMQFESTPSELFPYLLVNIGSGVSILKVTSDETYERISGTSLGGGTLWGLLSLLTEAKDYDEMLELSKLGDNKNVDMLVGDIYGGDYPKIGLKGSAIASSFGKVFKTPPEERKSKFKQEDISRSLLYLVSNNIGQIAYLNAQAHGIQRIYFSGFFIRGHPITMNTLSYAINFWSKGKIMAMFLRHEGYLGAMGAFLRHVPQRGRIQSFTENFTRVDKISGSSLGAVGALDEFPTHLTVFPLLADVSRYKPDTTDLKDPKLQQYWIDLLDRNLGDLADMALQWRGNFADTRTRASSFEAMYREHLQALRREPNMYGALTIRSLLDLREQCLREMGFTDIFENVKKQENAAALEGLPKLLKRLDAMEDEGKKLDNLIDNVLAGNMYDWGSTSVQEMLKKGELDFDTAKETVGHPQQFSQLAQLKQRLVEGSPYRKAVIFVDNSGADIILGIIPFARYLLGKGTTVVLAANTSPSVNDITVHELRGILPVIAGFDPVIRSAWAEQRLLALGTGSASPCLDLTRLSDELTTECRDVDFVVVEGMGRAIHTNFYARFRVDSLKIGVFKNPQVAKQLGANMYDAIVLYEVATPGSPKKV
ncbi:pantothenate kinase [Spizellomyces punctatus DAOM BR117]|uniref:Pantothenate kinase n=1 Tax=Spizellomyces punctatus (strain DAOM BR117) TaxID=645134 RepID=A0A0L0HNJ9_SPIPD|nr:pantothenate kinase [Spizellomyces punctatus DAOM BR117]KND02525.1 pantothenate kinase [Spizellomyces punctatus DAOM BR117]|eukprot:XP_016610564.1 pantothenate kinase [Spizellomyces punctatus DAOM BR117]